MLSILRGHLKDTDHVLLISVRTDDTKLIRRAFMLTSSRWPPKPGSDAEFVQPTVVAGQPYSVLCVLLWGPERKRDGRSAGVASHSPNRKSFERTRVEKLFTYCARGIGLRRGWLCH
jgi:hypothetical protein